MDQPGPRHPALNNPIIERPDLQSRLQRTVYASLTFVCWLGWVYLWLPALTLLSLTIEIEAAEKEVVAYAAFDSLLALLSMYHLPVLLCCALLAWAAYNIERFGKIEGRTGAATLTLEAIARHFGTQAAQMTRWQAERCLYVTHDAEGRVAQVDTTAPRMSVLV